MSEPITNGEKCMAARVSNIVAILILLTAAAADAAPAPAPPTQEQDPIMANDPAFMTTFTQQYRDAFRDGAIPAKYKQLSAATLSLVLKCEECLKSHVQMAIKLGANRQEIVEVLRIGLLTGGSAGLPTMEAAYDAMAEAKLK
jgi:AhpD family alkylhydroperoxidase